MVDVTDAESKNRRNYQRGNVINYLDGDSLTQGVHYGYGFTTLISDSSRVIKGGSWNDRAYWLGPGICVGAVRNQPSRGGDGGETAPRSPLNRSQRQVSKCSRF